MEYYDVNEEEKSNKKHFKAAKKIIDEANGIDATEQQVNGVLRLLRTMANIAVEQLTNEAKWDTALKETPKGYHFKEEGYNCRICGTSASGEDSWYDKNGLKCITCQKAVDARIISGTLAKSSEDWYSETELSVYFNVKGKALRDWIKKGIINSRVIPSPEGGKHYQVFLRSDNKGFLPPKEKLNIGGMEPEIIDGKEWMVSHPWYHYVDPFAYLKKYRIMQYLQPKFPEESTIQHAPEEPKEQETPVFKYCSPCSFPFAETGTNTNKKRKARRKPER